MKQIIKIILFIIGALILINAVILPFILNFHVGFILEGIVAVVILIYAFFFNKINVPLHIATIITFLIPIVFMTILAVYGNRDNADYNEDVVIVLGAGIRGETVSDKLAKRLDKAVEYHTRNPNALIIVCGGQGPQEDIAEALAMERYLIDKGVPQDKILKEDKSTSTNENLSNAKGILENYFPQGYSSVLITNDYHIYRAVEIADVEGISAKHINVQTEWYAIPANYLREMLAVAKLWIMP